MQYKVGDWLVVANENKLTNASGSKTVEPKVMTLLVYLCQHPGEVKSTEQLLADVWSDRVVTEASIYQTIAQLRKALGDKASRPDYIVTVPKKGYKLIAEVSLTQSSPDFSPRQHQQDNDLPEARIKEALPPDSESKISHPALDLALNDAAKRSHFGQLTRQWQAQQKWWPALLAIFLLTLFWLWQRPFEQNAIATIAVLPFQHHALSRDKQEIAQISARGLSYMFNRVTNLHTVSFTSSEAASRKGGTAIDIARELAADYLVEGQIEQLATGGLHLEVSLIRGRDGIQIWSGGRDVKDDKQEQVHLAFIKQMMAALNNHALVFKDTQALHQKAATLITLHKPSAYDEAIALLSTVTQFDEQDSQAFASLSQLYLAKYAGEMDKPAWLKLAKQHLYRALSIAPESSHALLALAEVQFNAGDFTQARHSAQQVLAKEPDALDVKLLLIRCYLAEQNLFQAKRMLLALQQAHAREPSIRLLNAIVAIQTGNQGKKHFTVLDELIGREDAPAMPYYFADLAITTALAVGAYHYALAWVDLRLQETPEQPSLLLLQARSLIAMGDLVAAEQVLVSLGQRPISQTFSAYEALYLAKNEQAQLLPLVEQGLIQSDNSPIAHLIHGTAAMYAGRFELASDQLEKGIELLSLSYEQRRLALPMYYGSLSFSLVQQGRAIEAARFRQLGLEQIAELQNDGVKQACLDVYRARLYSDYNPNMALHSLAKAVAAGYQNDAYLKQDVVLFTLNDASEFSALVAQAEQNRQRGLR